MHKKILATSFLLLVGCSTPPQTQEASSEPENVIDEIVASNFKTIRTGMAAEEVLIAIPSQGATITSPLLIKGKAPGYWFFEATAPVSITDWDGRIIGEGFIQTQEDWMTENLVIFSGEIEFELPEELYQNNGWVILQRHNASGLPEHDSAVEVPIQFIRE